MGFEEWIKNGELIRQYLRSLMDEHPALKSALLYTYTEGARRERKGIFKAISHWCFLNQKPLVKKHLIPWLKNYVKD